MRFWRGGYRLALVARRTDEVRAWAQSLGWAEQTWAVYGRTSATSRRWPGPLATAWPRRGCRMSSSQWGISVGIDTAEFADLEVLRATLETNVLGVRDVPALRPADAQRRAGRLVGSPAWRDTRPARTRRVLFEQGAVIGYCESLRIELRADRVRVVTLCPGYVDTPLTRGNPYRMPFLMAPDEFADRAYRAIRRGVSYQVIPWQMGVLAKLLRVLPNAWLDRLVAGRGRKPRRRPGP